MATSIGAILRRTSAMRRRGPPVSPPQTICISGCSSGLGLALAERLAQQGALIYAGLRDLRDAKRLPEGARPLRLDVTKEEEIAAAVASMERQSGGVDVLINNAGSHAIGPWEVVPAEVVRQTFEVNFFGAVALTKAG